jgi:TatD DNase family protein
MIDTHCHLTDESLNSDLSNILNRAQTVGVTTFIVPGIDPQSSQKAITLSEQFDNIYAAVGMYPNEVDGTDLIKIEQLLSHPKVVAVGEVGLDNTYTDDFPLEIQTTCLREQIHLASTYKKSLILHSRGTSIPLLHLLSQLWDANLEGRTVFHCCEPELSLLAFAEKHQVYIGVDGDLTYNKNKQDFIKQVPLELLVLETDAPYLTPEPIRSHKKFPNEPANVTYIAQKVAELHNLPVEIIDRITTNNAQTLFKLIVD